MSRNRIRHAHSMHWAAVLSGVVGFTLLAAIGVRYMSLKNQIMRTADETRRQEQEIKNWRNRNAQLVYAIQRLRSHEELKRRVVHSGLVKLGELETVAMNVETTTRLAKGNRIEGREP